MERVIDAPRDKVWRCWSEPELLKQWYCPKPRQVTEADMKLVPGERLVFTDGYSEGFVPRPKHFMTGYVQLGDEGEGNTRMVWGARHATLEDRQTHLDMGFEQGWGAAADQLSELARTL